MIVHRSVIQNREKKSGFTIHYVDEHYDTGNIIFQKSIINDAGIKFSGHTEYLAKKYNVDVPVMLLSCGEFRVALVTR